MPDGRARRVVAAEILLPPWAEETGKFGKLRYRAGADKPRSPRRVPAGLTDRPPSRTPPAVGSEFHREDRAVCGIAGVVDLAGRKAAPPDMLAAMAAALYHRGPDEDGFLRRDGIALANRRLSIV